MICTLRTFEHYSRAFRAAVKVHGWRFALLRSAGFLRRSVGPRLLRWLPVAKRSDPVSPFKDLIDLLERAPAKRPLLLIVSDIQIRQCIHYRIQQKIHYLERIGLQAMHLRSVEAGRLRAFLGLAHTVIIYRTALPKELMQEFVDSGARLIFEFDDLVVGRNALEQSGILSQVTKTQAAHLLSLSEALLKTAQLCETIIVSTTHLSELYAAPENGLGGKPSLVVPNFVGTGAYKPPRNKDVTFAFTSPSGSILSELSMLTGFLVSYDASAERDWSILIIGNDLAQKAVEAVAFQRGRVITQPFSDFENYLNSIARAETVLIPLSDNDFNRAKTAIRLLDAAIAGTQALFCPVGAYRSIQNELYDDSLCIEPHKWSEAGAEIGPVLACLETNVTDLQRAVARVYGVEAAEACYQRVFVNDLGMHPAVQSHCLVAA